MASEDRPTLTGERDGTPVTIEVDVPRGVWEDAVEAIERARTHPWYVENDMEPSLDAHLIEQLALDIRYFLEGERIPDEVLETSGDPTAWDEGHGDG